MEIMNLAIIGLPSKDKSISSPSNYVEYWSEGDFDKIVNEIYGVPFVLEF